MYTQYPGLTQKKCEEIWSAVSQLIFVAARNDTVRQYGGHVIVLDSKFPYQYGQGIDNMPILFEASIGPEDVPEKQKLEWRLVARMKAFESWRTGKSSRWLQQEGANLFDIEDTKYTGSYVGPTGIIVAFSGVQGDYDEAISETVECWLRASCRYNMNKKPDGVMLSEHHRIGDLP